MRVSEPWALSLLVVGPWPSMQELRFSQREKMSSVVGHMPSGEAVHAHVLTHGGEGAISVTVIPLGATITSVKAPDANGAMGEVSLGFDESEPYTDGRSPYFGCVAGRVATRSRA